MSKVKKSISFINKKKTNRKLITFRIIIRQDSRLISSIAQIRAIFSLSHVKLAKNILKSRKF